MARHESEMHRRIRELNEEADALGEKLQLANQRIAELCRMVNVLAQFGKVRLEDYQVTRK